MSYPEALKITVLVAWKIAQAFGPFILAGLALLVLTWRPRK